MKTLIRLHAILFLAVGMLQTAPAQTRTELSPEYLRIIFEAGLLFQKEDYSAVLEKLDEADAIQLDEPIALNMRGAVKTEEGEFEEARTFFDRAIEKVPEYFAPRFNLGEILLRQKDYVGAAEHFESMLDDYENAEVLLYKISLCYLLAGDKANAAKYRDMIAFPSDTPAYYFAHAIESFQEENKEEGDQWIASSMRVFGEGPNLFYLQSIEDFGWVDQSMIEAIAARTSQQRARAMATMGRRSSTPESVDAGESGESAGETTAE